MGRVTLDAGGPAGTPDMHQRTAPHMPTEAGLGAIRSRPQGSEGVAEQWAEMLEALMDLQPAATGRDGGA